MAKPERGVLFCPAMVRALLSDEKTVTRRLTPLPVGTVIWLREPWAAAKVYDKTTPRCLPLDVLIWYVSDIAAKPVWCGRTRVGRFLPKRLARPDRFEVVAVGEERLQDITEDQAIAEGALDVFAHPVHSCKIVQCGACAVEDFKQLWDSLHPAPGERWADNPVVYPHTLRRLA